MRPVAARRTPSLREGPLRCSRGGAGWPTRRCAPQTRQPDRAARGNPAPLRSSASSRAATGLTHPSAGWRPGVTTTALRHRSERRSARFAAPSPNAPRTPLERPSNATVPPRPPRPSPPGALAQPRSAGARGCRAKRGQACLSEERSDEFASLPRAASTAGQPREARPSRRPGRGRPRRARQCMTERPRGRRRGGRESARPNGSVGDRRPAAVSRETTGRSCPAGASGPATRVCPASGC